MTLAGCDAGGAGGGGVKDRHAVGGADLAHLRLVQRRQMQHHRMVAQERIVAHEVDAELDIDVLDHHHIGGRAFDHLVRHRVGVGEGVRLPGADRQQHR